ncbi:hypothetical protein HELRODRAFT_84604, partial [Helobdella robusta]|uniref:F5/8 type C domain-containing protein n=1 Tax=Helobdella robusta TaxID=6412 RepID=T1G5K7_HELRO
DDQWLQFDIGPPTLISGLVTLGKGDTLKNHWVTRYHVSYSNDSALWYYYIEGINSEIKEFEGNQDKDTPRTQYFKSPFVARFVRIHPTQWNVQIAMRAGLLGCPFNDQCGPEFVRIANNTPCGWLAIYKSGLGLNINGDVCGGRGLNINGDVCGGRGLNINGDVCGGRGLNINE